MKYKIIIYCLLLLTLSGVSATVKAQSVYDITAAYGNYSFSYNQTPEPLISVGTVPPFTGYQWYSCATPNGSFTPISGATGSTLGFSVPLTQTMYYMRLATPSNTWSNMIKLELVSVNWENINYVREHAILVPGQSDWKAIDQLPIGQKLQTTTYMDGLGRPIQKVSRETATPADPSNPANLWGDAVAFSSFDVLGRQPVQYLPYTTTANSGKYKTATLTDQPLYYSNAYGETSAFSTVTYDNSPLNRTLNVKSPGTSWAAGQGNSAAYELNDAIADNVQQFTIGYTTGSIPVRTGTYASNMLYKRKHTDENGKQVIEYFDSDGHLILSKTQIDDNPSTAHAGWICVYSVYDEFGLLRYRMQPEAVKWLDNHGWDFTVTDGQKVLDNLCFRYEYDEKGRTILKKAPGAAPLQMLYDDRDRVVFMQDGNQALKSPPEWTTNIYDELDRPIATTLYQTSKTVANLQADIAAATDVTTITVAAQGVTLKTYKNPITSTDLNNTAVTTIVKYNFYDDYSYPGAKTFNTSFDNALAYPSGGDAIVQTQRTLSMPTGSIVRALGTTTFLTSTVYYDDKGRSIQATEDNIKTGADVTTMQYQWDGRLLSSNTKHTATSTGYTAFSIVTKNNFDKLGRVTSIEKKYGTAAFKSIGAYSFDDMGRLKSKRLDPGYTGTGKTEIETLAYSYNIHNEITGINKNYALKAAGYNKYDNFFGLYLGYDNRDNVFGAAQLDGHVTGALWSTQGDDAQRRYDFTYDNAGRFIKAVFTEKEKPTDTWGTLKMDISVGGNAGGNISYDLNGNLQSMVQKAVLPGNAAAVNVDNLTYTYASLSNILTKVTDNGTLGTNNGKLGDFVDGANAGDDYVYDANGNLVIDLNKGAQNASGGSTTTLGTAGIKYNFLDKPEEIHITGKGTIKMLYDADGNKLQKSFTPEGSSVTKTTTYINEFVYEGDNLQYINFEEGRVRVMQAVSQNNGFDLLTIDGNIDLPGSKRGAFDFFVRDYQSNVRMILTEETHVGRNVCTMETGRSANEEQVFGQTGSGNEVSLTRTTKPTAWAANTSSSVSKLGNLAASKIGPNVLLKVMGGDVINAATDYYYQNNVTNSSGPNGILSSVLSSLISAISGSGVTNAITKDAAGNINTSLSGSVPFSTATSPDANNSLGNAPKAYLTILFFDERFNFIGENSTAKRVQTSGDGVPTLTIPPAKAPKNGYAYIYVSNESNEPVYFDNLQVSQTHGRIVEENHYYAYGLKIASISSRKLGDAAEGSLKNNNLYNDKELNDDADLNWYDYGFRSYDAQIGRFPQLDPLTDQYPELTNYQYASNDPIANIDIDGLEGGLSTTAATAKTLEAVTVSASKAVTSVGVSISTSIVTNIAGKIAINIVVPAVENLTHSVGTNQVGGKLIISPDIKNPSYLTAIEYARKTKEFIDIFDQFTNGSLGNTDFVFDFSNGGDEAGHSGIFALSEFNEFTTPVSEWAQYGTLDASEVSSDMHLQVKLQFGKYDDRGKSDIGYNAETITHEIFLHILGMIKMIKYLRAQPNSESVIATWYKMTQPGAEENDKQQHKDFLNPKTKTRQLFDKAIRGLSNVIKNLTHKKQLNKAVSDDIKYHKKPN